MKSEVFDSYEPKVVLAVGAHADDIDFSASGSLAVWAKNGALVDYVVITDGCKGTKDRDISTEGLAETRRKEQEDAAVLLGARKVHFLGYEDGNLELNNKLRKDLVRLIRQTRPDTVIVMDPTMVYSSEHGMLNHPDHRVAGQATLDAVYPQARDYLSYPELLEEQLEPHKVTHVLLTNFEKQNCFVDISETIDLKLAAIDCHISQFTDVPGIHEMVKSMAAKSGQMCSSKYAEGFVRIDVRP
jgi:LmbE family N-acetylglucosaminyl deacetylase